MPHTAEFYRWKDRVHTLFDALHPHHRTTLAEYAFGLLLARTCGLTSVVAHLAAFLAANVATLRQRLRELYQPAAAQIGPARSEFDAALCFPALVRWAAATHTDRRLVLALDPTQLTDRFRVLCVAVLAGGGGLPVAWAVQAADRKGAWNPVWFDLLDRLKAALGDGWAVLVLTDRGLESAALFRHVVALGWHPLMRVKAGGHFRPAGWHRGWRMGQFAPAVGRRWSAEGVAYPAGEGLGCTLLACWEDGHVEPWVILTDLPPAGASAGWYGWRMWVELGFRAVKRGCWGWHKTQMTAADRVARLWAVIAVATVYATEVGGATRAAEVPAVGRGLSRLRRGLLLIWWALLHRQPIPVGRIEHPAWRMPQPQLPADPLRESDLDTS